MARSSDHLDGLPDETERKLERLFASFDSSWKEGSRPRIADFLPKGPPEERLAALIELVMIDLEYAIHRDPSRRIEEYLVEYPELGKDRDLVLGLADREYRLRKEQGSSPPIKEYVARFPDLAARLVFRLEETEGPDKSNSDETIHYGGKSPGPTPELFLTTAPDRTVPEGLPDTGTPRYRHIRAYARGGLGEVFTAEDSVLSRRVALKRIRPQFADDPSVRRRFLREAEITATLEHPGIAPIHELIVDSRGQPWYVMRFLKGHTLRSAIERWHKPKAEEPEADRVLAFRNLLTRFVATCETMSYAHRLGVVHRDLTPANVMLGDHGETIVLDWGFATASGDPDVLDISKGPAASPLDESILKSGKLFGTPAFMSPEQAGMHQSAVGPASDVYGLGAILFMILTGRPPFVGNDLAATLRDVQAGSFPRPRELRPEVAPALEAIALKAMSLDPKSRYLDAKDLGRDIERWLADEPVSAYREPINHRIGRWVLRHRRWVAAAAVVGIVTLGLGASYAINRSRSRVRADLAAEQKIAVAKQALSMAGDDPTKLEKLADSVRKDRALVVEAGGSNALAARMDQILAEIDLRKDNNDLRSALTQARLEAANVDLNGQFNIDAKLRAYQAIFEKHDLDPELSKDEFARRVKARGPLTSFLVAILDDWAIDTEFDNRINLTSLANAIDRETHAREFRQALVEQKPDALTRLAKHTDPRHLLPERLHTIGTALLRLGDREDAATFLREAAEVYPRDFWLHMTTAVALSGLEVPEASRPQAEQEIRDYFNKAEAQIDPNPGVDLTFGNWLYRIGKTAEAENHYKRAVRLKPDLHPGWYNLGYIATEQGDLDRAGEAYLKAMSLKPTDSYTQNAFVATAYRAGKLDDAIAYYRARITTGSPQIRAAMMAGLGIALRMKGQHEQATKVLRDAVELDRQSSLAYNALGDVLAEQGMRHVAEAIVMHKTAVKLAPTSAVNLVGLATAHALRGDNDQACEIYRQAIDMHKGKLPNAHAKLGSCLARLGKFDEALAHFEQAGTTASNLTPNAAQTRRARDLAARLNGDKTEGLVPKDADEAAELANVCRYTGRLAQAVEFWEFTLTEDPEWQLMKGLGTCDASRDAVAASLEARATLEKATEYREKALFWLRKDLDVCQNALQDDTSTTIMEGLQNWKADPGFAAVRERDRLLKLPTQEQADWQAFWRDVDALIAETQR